MTTKNKSDDKVGLPPTESDLFIDRLKTVIKRLGGVAASARNVGVVESTVRSWRDGNSEPKRPHLVILADKADVSLAWLVAGEGEMLKNAIHEPAGSHSVSASEFDKILEKVENAVSIIDSALEKRGASMSPEKKGKLAAMCVDYLYDLPEDEKPDTAKILRLVKFGT